MISLQQSAWQQCSCLWSLHTCGEAAPKAITCFCWMESSVTKSGTRVGHLLSRPFSRRREVHAPSDLKPLTAHPAPANRYHAVCSSPQHNHRNEPFLRNSHTHTPVPMSLDVVARTAMSLDDLSTSLSFPLCLSRCLANRGVSHALITSSCVYSACEVSSGRLVHPARISHYMQLTQSFDRRHLHRVSFGAV